VAITPNTRKEDDRLRKELQNADLEKFKKAIKPLIVRKIEPTKKAHKTGSGLV
jgi:hypothetical protein